MLTTSGYENELGVTAYAEYKAKYRRSGNAEYNQALVRCGKAIAKAAEQDDFAWEFTVLDTNIQNAFCPMLVDDFYESKMAGFISPNFL